VDANAIETIINIVLRQEHMAQPRICSCDCLQDALMARPDCIASLGDMGTVPSFAPEKE
jgi:hypothetical protein